MLNLIAEFFFPLLRLMKRAAFYTLFSTHFLFPQAFHISDNPAEVFTIDRFANEVYYIHRYTGQILKTNLRTLVTTNTQFLRIPVFANTSHKAVYIFDDKAYIYDFDNDSTYMILDSVGNFPMGPMPLYDFSPNDEYLIIRNHYYSFKKEEWKSNNWSSNYGGSELYDWGSDSSIIYLIGQNILAEYFFTTGVVDTMLEFGYYDYITGFAYNRSNNILAYSIMEIIPTINFYDKTTNVDTIAFDPLRDDSLSHCWGGPAFFRYLRWSPLENRLVFFNEGLESADGIFLYDLDSIKTYPQTECDEYGAKYDTQWYNNDTIIYANLTFALLYGFGISHNLTKVEDTYKERTDNLNQLICYPNPFNSLTNIKLLNPSAGVYKIIIYNVFGQKIRSLELEGTSNNISEIQWDGKNDRREQVSSGIYLITAEIKTDLKSINFSSSKVIYLK
jgi:hypothetical protein